MGDTSTGVLIVSARGIDDVEGARKRVSRISGVVEAEYNSLTQKLHVKYKGDKAGLRRIELEIREALRSSQGRAVPAVGLVGEPRPARSEKPSRSDTSLKQYKTILVGYEGSENAKRALNRAANLAVSLGAELRVVVVVNTILTVYGPTAPYYPPGYQKQVMSEGKNLLDAALKSASDAGAKVSGSVEDGHPAEIILDVCERERIDLVVLGRRGISGVERFLLGGVSSTVVSHSKCDVLVVK